MIAFVISWIGCGVLAISWLATRDRSRGRHA